MMDRYEFAGFLGGVACGVAFAAGMLLLWMAGQVAQ